MADPFLGQISAFGFGFAPKNWAVCAGQLLPIRQSTALFSLLGTAFGGDGVSTFGLPDLRGVAIYGAGMGQGSPSIGTATGSETVPLDPTQLASHTHTLGATTAAATAATAAGNLLATTGTQQRGQKFTGYKRYSANAPTGQMSPQSLSPAGGGGQHNNMQPYIALNYCIALVGEFPQRP